MCRSALGFQVLALLPGAVSARGTRGVSGLYRYRFRYPAHHSLSCPQRPLVSRMACGGAGRTRPAQWSGQGRCLPVGPRGGRPGSGVGRFSILRVGRLLREVRRSQADHTVSGFCTYREDSAKFSRNFGGDPFGKNWHLVQKQGPVMAMGSPLFSPSQTATPGLSGMLINYYLVLNFLHSMYVYVTWRRSASTGPEDLRAYRSERAEPKGFMGLTLICGLSEAVRPGSGPRRFLTSCHVVWRHAPCSCAIEICEGACRIPDSITLAWVWRRGCGSMPWKPRRGWEAKRVAPRGGKRTW